MAAKPGAGEPFGSAEDRAAAVAVRALGEWFARVGTSLAAAGDDPESIHVLRVATRRAGAAVRLFADWVPAKVATRWEARLRRVRKAAGAAREADVLAEWLSAWECEPAVRDFLVRLRKVCRKARRPVAAVARRADRKDWFGRGVRKLLRRVHRRGHRDAVRFDVWARHRLKRVFDRFVHAAPHHDDIPTLHRLRVRAKELRYSLELLGGAFDPAVTDEAYRAVEEVQRDLGDVQDGANRLTALRDRLRESDDPDSFHRLRDLLVAEGHRLDRLRKSFLRSWPERERTFRDRLDRLFASQE